MHVPQGSQLCVAAADNEGASAVWLAAFSFGAVQPCVYLES